MIKVTQSESDLQNHLKEQLELIEVLGELYDKGTETAAKPIATAVRVILHDTTSSHSLVEQLRLSDTQFYDVVPPQEAFSGENITRVGSFSGLTALPMGGGRHTPYLDEAVQGSTSYSSFEEYWNKTVFIDNKKNVFSRRDLVLVVANQDGGAHVDPALDEKYVELSRRNSLGYQGNMNDEPPTDIEGAALAGIRQIGHEMLRTFKPEYPEKKMVLNGAIGLIDGMGMILSKDGSIPKIFQGFMNPQKKKNPYPGTPRKSLCPCGSGKKYKRCCGD